VARPIGRGRMVFGVRMIIYRFLFCGGLGFIMSCMARPGGRGRSVFGCGYGGSVGMGLFFEVEIWVNIWV
jgi:hypothetical protein